MEKARRNIGPALILLAGCFWGSMGIFVRRLTDYGFSSIQIVAIRVTLAALIFCMLLLIHRDHDDAAFDGGDPALYLADLDHADVRAVFP